MDPSRRNWVLAAAAGMLAVCLCGVLVAGATSGFLAAMLGARHVASSATPYPPAATAPATLSASSPSLPAATATPATLSPQIQAEMDKIQGQVAQLRGLKPAQPVERRLISTTDLRTLIQSDFLKNYSKAQADDDARVYAMLGLVKPHFDLWDLYLNLYTEQVAGFYDDEKKVMFVVQGAGFQGPERLTYAHEYTHALQDQHFDLNGKLGYNQASCESNSERCSGIQALVEGDATLLEDQWLRTYATDQDLAQIQSFYNAFESPVFNSAPSFLQDSFTFPYTSGLSFVQSLYSKDGWASVDSAYGKAPVSTEQIIHPDKYPSDTPILLTEPTHLASDLGSGWAQIDDGTMGELFTREVFQSFLPDSTATTAAAGWGGDFYQAFYDSTADQSAIVIVMAWDTIRDAQEAELAWRNYGDARFGEHSSSSGVVTWETSSNAAYLQRTSNQTIWIQAPDSSIVDQIEKSVTFPARKK